MRPEPDPEHLGFNLPTETSRRAVIKALIERAEAAGRAFDHEPPSGPNESLNDELFTVEIPAGRNKRVVSFEGGRIEDLAALPFENWRFIGDYEALYDTETGDIEAVIDMGGRMATRGLPQIWNLPGAQVPDNDRPAQAGDDFNRYRRILPPKAWSVTVAEGTREIEVSPLGPAYGAIYSRVNGISIKLRGFGPRTHDEALDVLEQYSHRFFFDLDLQYELPLVLQRRRAVRPSKARAPVSTPPSFPANAYEPAALALYRYGRSATDLPLLQYLAFYQALEYFFPAFAREEALRRVRSELKNPRFSPDDERALTRLITLALESSTGTMRERDQLRHTVRGCIDQSALASLIHDLDTQHDKHFTKSSQAIKGVRSIKLSPGSEDLRDQIADRIYAIRCRIVHTKQDGGTAGLDLLLPSSAEAGALPPDVRLLREIAQLALIARSSSSA